MAFENLNRLGELSIATIPEWVDQDAAASDYTGAPSSASDGVYLQGSPKCLIYVALRENIAYRTARVTVTFDAASTYTVTVNGVASAGATGASLAALLADLVTKTAALTGVAAVADPDDPLDTVLVTGDAEADYSIAVSVAGGAGTIACVADASSCGVRAYFTPGGLIKEGSTGNEDGWVYVPNAAWTLDYRGMMERADCAGFGRGYVELHTIDGHASDGVTVTYRVQRVMVGPAVLEATS